MYGWQGEWNNILSDVTKITVNLDAEDGTGEVVAFDNFGVALLPDCNCNDIPDGCEIQDDPTLDCNENHSLDACEVAVTNDCNGNCIPDDCDIDPADPDDDGEIWQDCNVANEQGFGIPDQCEIDVRTVVTVVTFVRTFVRTILTVVRC